MAIIDRDPMPSDDELLERLRTDHPEIRTEPDVDEEVREPFRLSDPGRVLLATASASAGVIHLVMVPSHASGWLAEGIAFALVGWFQIGVAALLLRRPSAALIRVSCLANLAFIAAWAWTRVAGPPFGPEAGAAHAATFIDITCVVLEAIVIVAGYELLARPQLGARLRSGALVALSIVPVGILAVTTMAIASPSAVGHGHSEAGGAEAAAGHDHGDSSGTGMTDGHDEGAAADAPADDKGLSLVMNGQGEGGGHSHSAETVALDPETQARLDTQLAVTKELADKYPTVAAAEADGYYRTGPFAPGLGAHYGGPNVKYNSDGDMSDEDLRSPMLIFDGIEPDSKLAGFMYNIISMDTENAPEGFIGPNDHWHYHTNVCIVPREGGGIDAPLGADTTTTQEICSKYGERARLIANTGYMVHVWTVPGYESSQGTFSNVNPAITCPDGSYWMVSMEETGTRSNMCRDVPA